MEDEGRGVWGGGGELQQQQRQQRRRLLRLSFGSARGFKEREEEEGGPCSARLARGETKRARSRGSTDFSLPPSLLPESHGPELGVGEPRELGRRRRREEEEEEEDRLVVLKLTGRRCCCCRQVRLGVDG
ncbi:unnamed protein product [Lampetra fluviatilis]